MPTTTTTMATTMPTNVPVARPLCEMCEADDGAVGESGEDRDNDCDDSVGITANAGKEVTAKVAVMMPWPDIDSLKVQAACDTRGSTTQDMYSEYNEPPA